MIANQEDDPQGCEKKIVGKDLSSHYNRYSIFHFSLENVKSSFSPANLVKTDSIPNVLLCKEFSFSGSNMHEKH